jgi:16S rRNA (uracil1498-N3)-methyltransferase
MKKIHRFLLPHIGSETPLSVRDSDVIHLIKNVLKLAVGEECIVFTDGGDDVLCSITEINKHEVLLSQKTLLPKIDIEKSVTACISITKRDSFELIVQKLTELGIRRIVPIISERTVKQSLRVDRLQKISDEALEQSGGATRVHISEPLSLQEALEEHKNTASYYFDMDGTSISKPTEHVLVFYIGPEGGWSDGDKTLFAQYAVQSSLLGRTVLRAETAAIVAAYTLLWE